MLRPTRPTQKPTAATPKKPSKPERASKPAAIRYACGCVVGVPHLERQKCPGCQRKARQIKKVEMFRFPTGSSFADVHWDGTNWKGKLIVPLANGANLVFSAHDSAVERLLRRLKKLFVERREDSVANR